VVVHAQDIRRPLGIDRTPPVGAVTEVARFLVSGTTPALTMAMTGRSAYCDDLTGPGVATLRARCTPARQ
jgi:hypothetical protein